MYLKSICISGVEDSADAVSVFSETALSQRGDNTKPEIKIWQKFPAVSDSASDALGLSEILIMPH
jgi:hypothetical protein